MLLWNFEEFMDLKAESPLRKFLDIIDNGRSYLLLSAPFGLKQQITIGFDFRSDFFSPSKVC